MYEVVSVVIAVTVPPAGQTPKQQIDHYKQEIVAHSQELKVESQGNETNVVKTFLWHVLVDSSLHHLLKHFKFY